jgi:OOP family OmpA-OmpF porin
MKKILLCATVVIALAACKSKTTNNSTTDTAANKAEVSKTAPDAVANNTPVGTGKFDINTIPVSDKNLDKSPFPYLDPPNYYTYNYDKVIKPESIRDVDKEYFAVNGKLLLQQGKTFKAHIERERNDGKKFNSIEVGQYYDDAIKALGGVQVNNVSVPKAQIDSVGNPELIDKRYGYSIDYSLLDDIKTYIIRTKTKQVWIQMTLMNDETGKITILEKAM